VLPFFLPFVVVTLGAALFGMYVSFTDWGIIGAPHWVGLKNYYRAVADPWVWKTWSTPCATGGSSSPPPR